MKDGRLDTLFNPPIPPKEGQGWRRKTLKHRAAHVLAAKVRSILNNAPADLKEQAIKILLQEWL